MFFTSQTTIYLTLFFEHVLSQNLFLHSERVIGVCAKSGMLFTRPGVSFSLSQLVLPQCLMFECGCFANLQLLKGERRSSLKLRASSS